MDNLKNIFFLSGFLYVLMLSVTYSQTPTPAFPEIITEPKRKAFEWGFYLSPSVSFTRVSYIRGYTPVEASKPKMVGNYGAWITYNIDKRLSIRTGLRRFRRYVNLQFQGTFEVEYEDLTTNTIRRFAKPNPTAAFLLKHYQIPITIKYNCILKENQAGYFQVGVTFESGGKEEAINEFDNPLALFFYRSQKLQYAFSSNTSSAYIGIGYEKKIFETQKLRIGLGYYHGIQPLIDENQGNFLPSFYTAPVKFGAVYPIHARNLSLELEIGF